MRYVWRTIAASGGVSISIQYDAVVGGVGGICFVSYTPGQLGLANKKGGL